MAKLYSELDDKLKAFILRQHIFFVGSAPVNAHGHINVSPKGMDGFCILDAKTVAYLDLTGSGIESIAHLKENGRFVIMFCSFDEQPLIVRLHGRGEVVERDDAQWERLAGRFPNTRLGRAIIKLNVERITDSCGWGVPKYQFVGNRDQFAKYDEKMDDTGLRNAQLRNNMKSIDGLAGLAKPSL